MRPGDIWKQFKTNEMIMEIQEYQQQLCKLVPRSVPLPYPKGYQGKLACNYRKVDEVSVGHKLDGLNNFIRL